MRNTMKKKEKIALKKQGKNALKSHRKSLKTESITCFRLNVGVTLRLKSYIDDSVPSRDYICTINIQSQDRTLIRIISLAAGVKLSTNNKPYNRTARAEAPVTYKSLLQ